MPPRAPAADLGRQNAVLAEQFERRGAALRELVELGELAAQTRDLDEFLVAVAERLLRVTGGADCDIFTVAADGELRCLVSVDERGRDHSVTGDRLELDDFGPNAPAVLTGEIVVVADRSDPALTEYDRATYDAFGFESEVCVPLVSGGATIALAEIYDTQPRDYAECLDFLRHVSQIVGGAYERAAALDRQAQQSARLASLLESSRAVAAAGRLDEALQVVARVTAETLDVPECIIYELDAAAEAIVPRAIYQRTPSGWDKLGVPFALADHPVERELLRSGAPREEHLSDPGLDEASRHAMSAWGDMTCLSVPLKLGDELTGLMALYEHERERHFSDEEVSLVRGLGEQAAAAIHNDHLLRRLEERNTVLNALLDMGRATTSTLQLGEVLSILAREAAAALASPFCLIWEYDAERDAIVERECWDVTGQYVVRSDVEALADRPEHAVVLFAERTCGGDRVRPTPGPGQPRVDGALRREDLPEHTRGLRRGTAGHPGVLRDRGRAPLQRRRARAGRRPGRPGRGGDPQRAALRGRGAPQPRAGGARASRALHQRVERRPVVKPGPGGRTGLGGAPLRDTLRGHGLRRAPAGRARRSGVRGLGGARRGVSRARGPAPGRRAVRQPAAWPSKAAARC